MKTPLTTLFTLLIFSAFGQVSLNNIGLTPGEYAVGFRHFTVHDSSRTYQRVGDWTNEHSPRPIPVSLWYPAQPTPATPLQVLDYYRILAEEDEWEYLPDEFLLNWFDYPNTAQNRAHLQEPTTARANAAPLSGNFPVVIYAPSLRASSIENFALCEWLASHGYIVLASPSRGADNKHFEGATLKDAATQARDLQFLLAKVHAFTGQEQPKIATLGFSFGGLSQVLAQAQHQDIQAMVSLDGSNKYQYYKLEPSPFFDVQDFDIPFMHLSQKDIPREVMLADGIDTTLNSQFEFFDQLTHAEAYHFKFTNLTHAYFSTLGVLFQTRDPRQDKPDPAIMVAYRQACEYALQFLQAYLRDDAQALAWLQGAAHHQAGILPMSTKTPVATGITFQDFHERAAADGYQNLDALWEEIKGQQPSFQIPEGRLNNLGLQLMFNPQTSQDGILILEFATRLYPNSANLFDSLAEAYLFADQRSQALAAFEKSLVLDGGNTNALQRIQQLTE